MRRGHLTGKALLSDEPHVQAWTGDGTTLTFTLTASVPSGQEDGVVITRNGLVIERVGAPATKDEFTVSSDQVTFGLAPDTTDRIRVQWWT